MKKFCKILESLFVISLTVVLCSCPGDDIFDDKESSGGGIENNGGSSEGENNEDIPDNNNLTGVHQGHEWVDLGLSVKWATCNVGANRPEEPGGYYAWGETKEKNEYTWETYKYGDQFYDSDEYYSMSKYCIDSEYGTVDNKVTLELSDDVAHVKWGGNWRMPTKYEMYELFENCTWEWIPINGMRATGPNGNSIYLPATGLRYDVGIEDAGSGGYYYSSSLAENCNPCVWTLSVAENDFNFYWDVIRMCGCSVRPVCE